MLLLLPVRHLLPGKYQHGSGESDVTVLPFRGDDDSLRLIGSSFKLSKGKMEDVLLRDGVMISSALASKLGHYSGA